MYAFGMAVSVESAGRQALVLAAEPVSVREARGWIDAVVAGLVADQPGRHAVDPSARPADADRLRGEL